MDSKIKSFLNENIQANIRHIRAELGLTQHGFANLLQIPQKNLAAMEEKRSMSLEIIYKISQFTGISIDTLLTTKMS